MHMLPNTVSVTTYTHIIHAHIIHACAYTHITYILCTYIHTYAHTQVPWVAQIWLMNSTSSVYYQYICSEDL